MLHNLYAWRPTRGEQLGNQKDMRAWWKTQPPPHTLRTMNPTSGLLHIYSNGLRAIRGAVTHLSPDFSRSPQAISALGPESMRVSSVHSPIHAVIPDLSGSAIAYLDLYKHKVINAHTCRA